MKKENLKLILESLETAPNSTWVKPEYNDNLYVVIDVLLKEVFNKDQYEWIEWWIWETDFGKRNDLTKNSNQMINGEKVIIDSFDNLWKAIKHLEK
jgi:hypothetical protein